MKNEIGKKFLNWQLDTSRMHAPNDPKDLKKIKNRVVGMVTTRASEMLKQWNFLKYKTLLKTVFE